MFFAGSSVNDLYEYDPALRHWLELTARNVTGDPPTIRYWNGFAAMEGKLYVFGGIDAQSPSFNEGTGPIGGGIGGGDLGEAFG